MLGDGRLSPASATRVESLGATLRALHAETAVGPYPAVVPTLRGQGWITGLASYVVDADDPFPEGYTVRDIW
ncbi:MAG TPA: proline racemase family protein [Methylomirabilota bacterium]|nr:proline racemase family protein [Methylomirabilota bacterium]